LLTLFKSPTNKKNGLELLLPLFAPCTGIHPSLLNNRHSVHPYTTQQKQKPKPKPKNKQKNKNKNKNKNLFHSKPINKKI